MKCTACVLIFYENIFSIWPKDEGVFFVFFLQERGNVVDVADAESSARLTPTSTPSPYIFHSYLQCFFFVEVILLRHVRTIKDSFEATWPLSLTLKALHLLVLDVKLNPLMISSLQRSHGKFLVDYIVGKCFELDIELKQTFFFLL